MLVVVFRSIGGQRRAAADLTSACTQSAVLVTSGQTQSSGGSVLETTPHAARDTLEHVVVPEPLTHDQNPAAPTARSDTASLSIEAVEPSRGSAVFESTSHRVMDDGNASEPVEQDPNPVVPTARNDTGSSSIEATDLPETASNSSATGPSETWAAETLNERELLATLADQLGTVVSDDGGMTGQATVTTLASQLGTVVNDDGAMTGQATVTTLASQLGTVVNDDGAMTGQATVTTLASQLGTVVNDDGGMTGQATVTVVTAETLGEAESLAAGLDSMTELPGSSAVDPPDQGTMAAADARWSDHPSQDHLLHSFWNTLFEPDSETDNADQLVRLLDSITEPLDVQQQEASRNDVPLGFQETIASGVDGSFSPHSPCCYRQTVEKITLSSEDLELFKACEKAMSLEWTKALLEKGANVNAILDAPSRKSLDPYSVVGDTPLHTLAHKLDWNCDSQHILDHTRLLGDWGAVPDTVNQEGVTPLMLAVEKQCPQTVQVLVDLSRDVDRRNPDRLTALHLCFMRSQNIYSSGLSLLAEQNCFQIATSLINAGARMELTDSNFQTPLVLAIRNNYPMGARFLILQNCDPNFPASDSPGADRSMNAKSPFSVCLETGDWNTLHLLLQAGCRCQRISWLQFGSSSAPGRLQFSSRAARELPPDLVARCCQPRSLMESCRMSIRQTLRSKGVVGDRLERTVEELPVPVPYRNFILMKDQGPGFCTVS